MKVQTSFPELKTARLRLRAIVQADTDTLFAIHSDADMMRWYGVDPMVERSEALKLTELFASWFSAGTGYRWGVEHHKDGRLIGTCGLFRWNKSWHSCSIGYELARDSHGHGYMQEALGEILAFGFNNMRLHRIQAETHSDNAASINLLTRLRFQFEGVHREQAFWDGRFHDLRCYSLLEPEWRSGKRA